MIKLKVDSKRNLSFIERDRILQGEHKFDTLQIALPEKIDSNDEYVSGMLIKIFFVHDKDRVTRQVIPDQSLNVETVIDYTLTEKARRWLVYVCFYKVGDEDIEVGKTNPVAVSVNHIPYNEALDIKSKDPDILLFKGDKGDPGKDGVDGKDGKDGEQGPPGETIRDYTELENKPSINNVILQGNKTSNDLGLQKKLTAGTNISIGNDGTISASGGVTSYNDLTDKPVITADGGYHDVPSWTLLHNLEFELSDFDGLITDYGNNIHISIKRLFSKFHFETHFYDFNRIGMTPYNGTLQFNKNATIQNFPTALNRIDRTKTFFIYQAFNSSPNGDSERTLLRKVFGRSANGEYLEYAQLCYIDYYDGRKITSQSDWVELTGGGSQIVSGVVNQNGTITFTDTDGNTFTTSGSSVIGDDGFSPTATVTQTQSGATVTITDKNGTTTANISNGADGQDYVLTAQDKSDIADIVLNELPTTTGVLYGNASN